MFWKSSIKQIYLKVDFFKIIFSINQNTNFSTHIKSKCPLFMKSKESFKEALATWSDEDQSTSSNESSDDNICLMAQHEDFEVTSHNFDTLEDNLSFEELQDAFDQLVHDFKKLSFKNALLKKKIISRK